MPYNASVPAILPLYILRGIFCMEAKGSNRTTLSMLSGKKGRGITSPARKPAKIVSMLIIPLDDRLRIVDIYTSILNKLTTHRAKTMESKNNANCNRLGGKDILYGWGSINATISTGAHRSIAFAVLLAVDWANQR